MDDLNFDTRSDSEIEEIVAEEYSFNFAKYEFNDYDQYIAKREALEPCNHNFFYIPTDNGICHVDVIWIGLEGHPYGWQTYAIDFDEGQGINEIKGFDYQQYKF